MLDVLPQFALVDFFENRFRREVEGSLEEERRRDDGQRVGGGPFENGVVHGIRDTHFGFLKLINLEKNLKFFLIEKFLLKN